MTNQGLNVLEALENLDPARLDYQSWCSVGMALRHEGYPPEIWDQWSARDPARYHPGECFQKWNTFRGTRTPVTAGTIIQLALNQGWNPAASPGHEIGWEDSIGTSREASNLTVINRDWMEIQDLPAPPARLDGPRELIRYLKVLFEPSENVGYVMKSYPGEDGRPVPTRGCFDRTADQLIQALTECGGDLGRALGDYDPEAGAWIRFNPLDGRGVKNENVTEYRYALVESDTLELPKQYSLMRELQLPIAVMVHSGKKSIHAIVRIEAKDYDEYRQRVDYLYRVCQQNGMEIDRQNRNPSRLSRMPGVLRAGHPQYILGENLGLPTFEEWKEYIESVHDNLPDPENLSAVLKELPPLAPELIRGVLRCGHKMLISGPSKAGKSFALIELCIAIAEGRDWLGLSCLQGNILYVNLELDRASCLHRFVDVYRALGVPMAHPEHIEIWNLRGASCPMDRLAPKLIRRARKKNFIAVVIDPIYKVITGDENAADQMSAFCNQFDRICTELGCAVIYCHHHSKGAQGAKRSMDRASGSGVFARDPDALLDLIELEIPLASRDELIHRAAREICLSFLQRCRPDWETLVSRDDRCSHVALQIACEQYLSPETKKFLDGELARARETASRKTGWRIEGILREFAPLPPRYTWFEYPVHRPDDTDLLRTLSADGERRKNDPTRAREVRSKNAENRKLSRREQLENALLLANGGDPATVRHLADYLEAKENTVRKWLRENGYGIDKNTGTIIEIASED